MTLRDYAGVLRDRALLVIAVALLATGAAFGLAERQSPRYEATAQVLLEHVDVPSVIENTASPGANVQPDRNASTQARLARQESVARDALVAAGRADESADTFLADSSVGSDPSTDVLDFTVHDRRPGVAIRLATAYARAFIGYRLHLQRQPFLSANQAVTRGLESLRAAGRGAGPLAATLVDRQQRLQTLAALQTADAVVVGTPDKAHQTQPRPLRAVAIALPIGTLLGIVLALVLHLLDARVRTTADIEQWLDMPLLGRIPPLPRRLRRTPALFEAPTGQHAASFRALRANVELANRIHGGPTLLVTGVSGSEFEGKSIVVANLGLALARAGYRVMLVDLDLGRQSLAPIFGLAAQPGITDVLLGRAKVDEAIRHVGPYPAPTAAKRRWRRRQQAGTAPTFIRVGGTLEVLTLGTVPANPADLVGAHALEGLLEHLRGRADIVILDTAPALQSAEAIALSPMADAVAVVVRVGSEHRSALSETRRLLELCPVAKLGFVATGSAVRPGQTHDGEADRHFRQPHRETVS